MPALLDRYKAGEQAAVWAEMDALDLRIPANRKLSDAVLRETIKRARANVESLLKELPALGYIFQHPAESEPRDYPLEMRLDHALAYVKERGEKKYRSNPWSHPALAWVKEEEIELPERFRNGMPPRAIHRPPCAFLNRTLDAIEEQSGHPLPHAVRAWFENIGAVNLAGTHPILNPEGRIAVLSVTLESIDRGSPPGSGAAFVADIRHAFAWAGFPGWSGHAAAPHRELDLLRSSLQPI